MTDAFDQTLEICRDLGLKNMAQTYPSFMNGLHRYARIFDPRLRKHCQRLTEEVGGRYFRTSGWVPIGFDGSRATAPRTASNEEAFCAPNHGHGKRAKYGKKKFKDMRRQRNQQNPPQPQAPQAWITLMWHMGLRLRWTWRLGPSNSSERDHVKETLEQEEFPKNTLFCGDAGFVGYPLWSAIAAVPGANFLVRVGVNVNLLSEQADVNKKGDGIVLCWPKGQMNSGAPPLRLRLVQVKIGKSTMRVLRKCMRTLHKDCAPENGLLYQLSQATVQRYRNPTDKKARYRPKNSDKKPLGDPTVRKMTAEEREQLREYQQSLAA